MQPNQSINLRPIGEYFTVADSLPVQLNPVAAERIPSDDELQAEIPELFKLCSELAGSDQSALQRVRSENPNSPALIDALALINQRMGLMLGYVLSHTHDDDYSLTAHEFGGGGFRVKVAEPFTVGDKFQANLIFREESLAVYCYVECVECETQTENTREATFSFLQIREQDHEHVIRHSLHSQTRHLKARAEQRKQADKPENS
ncbi:MAG: PilZ domain-containing protein [Idiomarinaceae bacterium]|nr:PilZ domain-containing protein [Idiomarinaceae bacterium]